MTGNDAGISIGRTKGILTVLAVTAVLFAVAPASAKGMKCTEANMAKTNDMMMKMPDGDNKTMGMKEMTMAQDSMGVKKMGATAACT